MTELFRGAKMDLPFVTALVYLVASGRVAPDRAETCLERQRAMALEDIRQAAAVKDKARRGRTAVLRNTLSLMDALQGRLVALADTLELGQEPDRPPA